MANSFSPSGIPVRQPVSYDFGGARLSYRECFEQGRFNAQDGRNNGVRAYGDQRNRKTPAPTYPSQTAPTYPSGTTSDMPVGRVRY